MFSRKIQATLLPNSAMIMKETDGQPVYHSHDNDPFFQIITEDKIIKAGWYIFSYSIRLNSGSVVLPKIYYDFGHGYSEQHHWKLFYSGSEIFGLVKVPWSCYRLRFDVSEKNIEFESDKFSLRRVSKLHSLLHLISILKKLGISRKKFLKELISQKTNSQRKQLIRSVSDGSYSNLDYHKWSERPAVQLPDAEALYDAEMRTYSVINREKVTALSMGRQQVRQWNTGHIPGRPTVDIIVPVYNGLEYVQKLIPQILQRSDLPFNLFIIDDCSPDPHVFDYIMQVQKENSQVKVHRNEENIGFTRTVNKLIAACDNEIIVLLNSDIEVPSNWLSRLIHPMMVDPTIGTITPMSNCATICSFPRMGDNEILTGHDVEGMNTVLSPLETLYEDIPTGVGFCLVINKNMIEKTGLLNEEAFPRGYGEEVDLCFRGRKKGFRSVLNMGLYVYHKHGASFTSTEKLQLMRENQQKLENIHTDFSPVVQKYFRENIFILFKVVYLLKLARDEGRKLVLFLDHDLGGGTNTYSKNYQEDFSSPVYINGHYINPNNNAEKQILFSIRYKNFAIKFMAQDLGVLLDLLDEYELVPDKFILNNLVSYAGIDHLIERTIAYKKKHGTRVFVKVMCHDFYPVCPNFLLFKDNEEFCGVPADLSVCRNCLSNISNSIDARLIPENFTSLPEWRDSWKPLLTEYADQVVMFSESTRRIFLKVWPELEDKSVVKPHAIKKLKKYAERVIYVGILGSIHSVAKGAKFVHDLAIYINQHKLKHIKLVSFGGVHPHYDHDSIVKTGPYTFDDIHQKLKLNKIDVILIPSDCSETFSFTTREAIETGIPTACFPIGGQYDQVKHYDKGIVIDDIRPASFVHAVEEYFKIQEYEEVPLRNPVS